MDNITLKQEDNDSCLSCVSCDDNCPVLVAVPNKIAKRTTMLAEELKKRKEKEDVPKETIS